MKKFPCFLALDLEDEKQALSLAEKLSSIVWGFKVGPRLYFNSPSILSRLSSLGKVFLDFKFHDIPSTVEASVKAGFQKGADYLTVHSDIRKEALSRMAQIEKDFNRTVLVVSVLTSQQASPQQVLQKARLVHEAGLKGFVCSAFEVSAVKKEFPHFFVVTPGIRLESKVLEEDQERVATPQWALSQGADALVMGRSLLNSQNPVQEIQNIWP